MPNDLLDLSLEQVKAVVAGYQDRELDLECHCVLTGYYAGYYLGAKRAKKPGEIIKKLLHYRSKALNTHKDASSNEPDLEYLHAMDSKFAQHQLKEMTKPNG